MNRIKEIKLPLLCLSIFTVAYTAIVFIIGGVVSKRGIDSAFVMTYAMMLIAIGIYYYSLFVGISDKPGQIVAVNGPGVVAFIYFVFTFIMTTILYFIDFSGNMIYVLIFYIFFVFIFLMFYAPALHHVSIVKQAPKKLPKVKRIGDLVAYYESFIGYVKEDSARDEIEGIIDSIRNFLKENNHSIELTQHSIFDIETVDSRIQLFNLDLLKRKIFVHLLSLSKKKEPIPSINLRVIGSAS